uniref:Uncharacterized protein n=1 Tax=Cryptococcus bacillisporus CA1280 TaxID=1296109 RepID=A0A0D0VXP5_CRYGA|nr:hypothetical protein I312_00011 [Cryptococcus bacillisporus CA1280]
MGRDVSRGDCKGNHQGCDGWEGCGRKNRVAFSPSVHELDARHVLPPRHLPHGPPQPRLPVDAGPYPPHPPPLAHPCAPIPFAHPIAPPSLYPTPPPAPRTGPFRPGNHAVRSARTRYHHRRCFPRLWFLQRSEEYRWVGRLCRCDIACPSGGSYETSRGRREIRPGEQGARRKAGKEEEGNGVEDVDA